MKGAEKRLIIELLCPAAKEDDKRKETVLRTLKLLDLTEKMCR